MAGPTELPVWSAERWPPPLPVGSGEVFFTSIYDEEFNRGVYGETRIRYFFAQEGQVATISMIDDQRSKGAPGESFTNPYTLTIAQARVGSDLSTFLKCLARHLASLKNGEALEPPSATWQVLSRDGNSDHVYYASDGEILECRLSPMTADFEDEKHPASLLMFNRDRWPPGSNDDWLLALAAHLQRDSDGRA